ncbi:DEAD/DEAH box helicase family protein [bacterium]|nr:DEAD/DEAH box helicase family protein [bacterium]
MNGLAALLQNFRKTAKSEREKGDYFERLVKIYLKKEPYYADLYAGKVWLWEEWRREWISRSQIDPGADAGIDLVAETTEGELHAIQAKFYDESARLTLDNLSTFFMASGKKHFSRRWVVLTATESTHHLREAVKDQLPPVNFITLAELENSKIDWASYQPKAATVRLQEKKQTRDYQRRAIADVLNGLAGADRGKLIMACGTGKTLTSLRLAEQLVGKGGKVLILVPSLNLLSQTLTEWTQEAEIPLHSFAVCSDSEVGKKRGDDHFELALHELQYPATTEARSLAKAYSRHYDDEHLTVVFSTYHSIAVLSEAQQKYGLPEFDLILCDEAHRTTGQSFDTEDESAFVRVHDQAFLAAKKRVYMTATPRVYGTAAKVKAEQESIVLYSMDNEAYYGKTLHTLSFSEAVHNLGVLCDYKVIVLTISEEHVSRNLQKLLADTDNAINVNDAAKIVGCWRALSKMDSQDDLAFDPLPMKRAVAFAQVIEVQKGARVHKVSSKNIAAEFQNVIDEYRATLLKEDPSAPLTRLICETEHVDGGMSATEKNAKLQWLKDETPPETCRVLSNVRCLSEGVDVPALDAVLFLTPRNSQVDVVQSVGRVMRKPKDGNKKLGYVVLPVVIPADRSPEEALNDNQTYRVVWEVLQALRSHDDRFDAMVNKLDLTGQDRAKMEVIAISDKLKSRSGEKKPSAGKGNTIGVKPRKPQVEDKQTKLDFSIGEIERAIVAKVVQKCGNRLYWDEWAQDIARIAATHITRLTTILDDPRNVEERTAFDAFVANLHADINDCISRDEAIEMLAQHLVTRPVFDALFEGYSFTQHNPVSAAMQGVLTVLESHHLEKEADTLTRMYESVQMRAAKITDIKAKQRIIVELYNKFFRNAFKKMTDRLGIVYTPVEVVDFIIHSINNVLQSEFGQTLGSRDVHILDPFTGTGTFITRLLQSGLIAPEELPYKYQNEIHANEIVLLAYYIAAINIEAVYHSIVGGEYQPFAGICLTDTFNLPTGAKDDLDTQGQVDNSTRLKRQRALDIRVIMGNPPYSAGQGSANDDAANLEYPNLDHRISQTYIARSLGKGGKRAAYDSYIRAIRWASDRIGNSGVIGFVSGSGFIEKPAMDGIRKCLVDEFSCIYVLNLRGDIRRNMLSKGRAGEGQNIFGSRSMTGIAISLFVKNPDSNQASQVIYHDLGSDLTCEEKLEKLETFGSIAGISNARAWKQIIPDIHGDWLGQRDERFSDFFLIGTKKNSSQKAVLFKTFSNGVVSNRDAWVYSYSRANLTSQCRAMIAFYNCEVVRYRKHLDSGGQVKDILDFVEKDTSRISWGGGNWQAKFAKGKNEDFEADRVSSSLYRPFTKMWHYGGETFNHSFYSMQRIFPNAAAKNYVICTSGVGARSGFSVLMADCLINLHTLDTGQCFPLHFYDKSVTKNGQSELFSDKSTHEYKQQNAITDDGLAHFQSVYPTEQISKEDVFYYVYGLLHSPDYRERFADNLTKELPRIPAVKSAVDFWAFSKAGRTLGELHVGYESVTPYPVKIQLAKPREELAVADYRVTQMKFAKGTDGEKLDKTTVIYNPLITLTGIPLEAYDYIVNGKSALEWVMERQAVTTHKASGIVNDANDWAIETIGNPAYPLELFQRVITVSLETLNIVRDLPPLGEIAA